MDKSYWKLTVLVLAVCLAVSCATTSAPRPTGTTTSAEVQLAPNEISWQGTNYRLAETRKDNGTHYFDYLRDGETTTDWENMITVQISAEPQIKAIQAYIESTKPFRTQDVRIMKNDANGEIMVDALLFFAERDLLEHNLIKYTKNSDGQLVTVSFQTRVKISSATTDPTLVSEKIGKPRSDRINFLSSFDPFSTKAKSKFVYTPEVRKMSKADDLLFRDLTTAIGGVRFADEVYFARVIERRIEKIEVLVPYDSVQTGVEKWFIVHDGAEVATYLVSLAPDGSGGTTFSVKLEK